MTGLAGRLAALVGGVILSALPMSAAAQGARETAESVVLTALNVCWEGEGGADVFALAHRSGFSQMPGTLAPYFYRDVAGRVVTLSASYSPNSRGQPEPACRITVMKPQLDTPWTPQFVLLPNIDGLIEVIVEGAQSFTPAYRVIVLRQPHPVRTGRTRTLLKAYEGSRGRMIYVEESREAYEFLYVNGHISVIDDPSIPDFGTDPTGRAASQAFVDDRWAMAFCELNPHVCAEPEQVSTSDYEDWTLPFSGIGATGGGNRSAAQRSRDEAWWRNYHETGRGRFD